MPDVQEALAIALVALVVAIALWRWWRRRSSAAACGNCNASAAAEEEERSQRKFRCASTAAGPDPGWQKKRSPALGGASCSANLLSGDQRLADARRRETITSPASPVMPISTRASDPGSVTLVARTTPYSVTFITLCMKPLRVAPYTQLYR